ncbi:MAG: hypothetical protein PHE12_02135, partial [Clostridia bacterium]|nr:hypothetical protein [Clostridia bacterium]
IKPQDFCQNDYTASYKKEVYLSIGDIINFEVNCYIKDISDDFVFDIKISEPYSKVTYQAENTVICHNILNGNSAMPYDNITDGIVEGYYSDENCQQSFDFQQPISQDTFIYIKKGFDFDVTLNGNMLTVDAVKLSGCNYQFWAKTVTDTDENKDNLSSSCGFWNMIQPFSEINSLTVNLATLYKEDGRYHFIVRKKIGGVVSDLYKSFNCDGLSGAKITSVKVNGELFNGKAVAVNKDEPFNISLSGSGENLIYSVICDNQITHCGGGGDFDIDISNFNDGFHIFTLKAESHNYCDQTELKIYIYGDYNEYTPVINSLSGKLLHSGLTKYTMQLSCADGSNISAESLNDLETVLYSENTKLSPSFQYVNGVLNAVFTIDYHNKHGIYYISGSVKYCGKVTDTIVYYYKEQARAATLYQYCDKTVIQVGETFNIRAEGSIEGEQDGLLYAYYREDANGWQMIRDYSYNSNLIWTPLRPGAYIIQVRIKGEGEGSWEKALSKTYTVTGGSLSGEISLSIINYAAGLEQTQMAAGTPYLLSATYSGAEDVLFMYLVSSENIKTKYLCNYSVSGDYIFIPNKPDNYVITVRVINAQNFSYKDMSENINIFSVI